MTNDERHVPRSESDTNRSSGRKRKRLPYSDIDLSNWRDYPEINTDTLWLYNSRGKGNGHEFEYHGNYIPQLATQLLLRYTKAGDIALDMFLGSGTTAIEALNLGRRCIGVEIQSRLVEHVSNCLKTLHEAPEAVILEGDSTLPETEEAVRRELQNLGADSAQLLVLHPPYWDIIHFSDDASEISNETTLDGFLDKFGRVASTGYNLLERERFAALIIGDKYADRELIPLGFLCMQVMTQTGFRLKSIVVKNIEGNEIGKGRTSNLWRYRALAGGFHIFKHEYVIIFQKPG